MTAEEVLLRLRGAARRKNLPGLADFAATRGEAFATAHRALKEAGYYRGLDDTPKRRRKCIDAALAALKAGE